MLINTLYILLINNLALKRKVVTIKTHIQLICILNQTNEKMAKKTKPVVDENLQKWEEFAAAHSAQYALIDADGNLLSDCTYDFIREPENGFAVFKQDGKYGFLSLDGSVAIPAIYESVSDFNDGLAAVKVDGRWGFINEKGEMVISPKYEDRPYFREDLAAVVIDGKHGFIDKSGTEVIAPIYEYAFSFQDGLACVKVEGKLGFIDKNGKMIIPPLYDKISPDISARYWRDGYAVVTVANKTGLIDRTGKTILPLEYDDVNFFPSMVSARQTLGDDTYFEISVKPNGTGLLSNGRIVIEPIYDKIAPFNCGVAAARKNGKWGYIDPEGNTVLPFEYDSVSSFSNNNARVTKDKRTYIIDKTGREICDKIEMLDFGCDYPLNGFEAGIKDDKYGVLDDANQFIVPCEFDNIERWGIVPKVIVYKDNKYGIYDLSGNEVVKTEYEYIDTPRTEGVPVRISVKRREKEGVMSTDGKIILNPEDFTSCSVQDKVGVIIVRDRSEKDGLRHFDGSEITPCVFDSIYSFSDNGTAIAKSDGKYGLINPEGQWIIPAEYEAIDSLSEGLIGAKKDDKWGFLNDKNEWVIAPAYEQIYRNFENGYARMMKDGKYILINSKGKELTKPSSTLELYKPADGLIRFKVGRKLGYLNMEGAIAIKPAFEEADDFKEYGCALVSVKVDKNPMWTFVTKDGKTHETFDKRVYNLGQLIPVEKDGKKGFFRPNGTMVVPFILKQVPRSIEGPSVIQFV